ncbi:MAG: IS200/IS605 family transposase [Sphingobacteriaceae bacterium]|nr:IS200/IS605 family transposase [Sphingobacteriaceae bacterium]
MTNTYTQIHLQIVFAVKYREGAIRSPWKNELYKYITKIIQNNGHKMICINGMPDHIHILIGLRPAQSISELLREVKSNSSKWINEKKLVSGKFEWQEGYGAFSYSKRDLRNVIDYIENQEIHHSTVSFKMEYESFLKEFEIEYNERFVFKELV